MKVTIEFNSDNAAFDDESEIKRVLLQAIQKICQGKDDGKLMDINGNKVGCFEVER